MKDSDSVSKTEARERERTMRREKGNLIVSFFSRTRQPGDPLLSLSRGNLSLSDQNKERSTSPLASKSPKHQKGKRETTRTKKTYLQSCLLQRDQSPSRAFAGFVHLPVRPLPDLFELFVALVDRGRVTHGLLNFFFFREYKRFVIFMKREKRDARLLRFFFSRGGFKFFARRHFFLLKIRRRKQKPKKTADFSLPSLGNKMSTTNTNNNVNKFQAAFRAKVERVNETKKKIQTQRTIHGEDEAPEGRGGASGTTKMNAISNEKMMRRRREEGEEKKVALSSSSLPAGFFDEHATARDAKDEEREKRKEEEEKKGGVATTTTRSIDNTQKTVADETSGQEYLKQKEEEERMKREEEEAAIHAKELADEVIADTVAGFDKVDALREKAMEILMKKKKKNKEDGAKKVNWRKGEEKDESSDDDDSDENDDFAWRRKKRKKST